MNIDLAQKIKELEEQRIYLDGKIDGQLELLRQLLAAGATVSVPEVSGQMPRPDRAERRDGAREPVGA